MSSLYPVIFACITCFSLVNPIIIFNNEELLIDTPFDNIKNAVKSGNMKCGLQDENLDTNESVYNGTHIIFSYSQNCDRRSIQDYEKKDDIYFNEFMNCSLDFPLRECRWRRTPFYEFIDTCSIEYDKACEETFLGPCVASPENSTTSITTITTDRGTDEYTTEEIQRNIQNIIWCDPNIIKLKQENRTQFEIDYKNFYYGRQLCIKQVRFHGGKKNCGGHGTFRAGARHGYKWNKSEEPVNSTDVFNK